MLLFHFCQQYLPAIFSRDQGAYHFSFEKIISYSPLYMTVNAQFFIAVFWGISGFLMGYLYYSNDSPQEMRRRMVKKYIYFLAPMLLSTVLSYKALEMGIIGSGGGGVTLFTTLRQTSGMLWPRQFMVRLCLGQRSIIRFYGLCMWN